MWWENAGGMVAQWLGVLAALVEDLLRFGSQQPQGGSNLSVPGIPEHLVPASDIVRVRRYPCGQNPQTHKVKHVYQKKN